MTIYKQFRGNVLKIIRLLLSCLIPVKPGKILFQSDPDYSDNARAFSDYLIAYSDYKMIWSVEDPSRFMSSERVRFIEKDGGKSIIGKLKFIYETVSSQFLISTHGAFLFANKRNQTFVCCWHGMPLKRIAAWQNPDNKNYLNNTAFILSTSKYYIPILAKCFGKKESEIAATGYPRNDWLFQDSDVLERMGLELKQGHKLLMYLPTFRKTGQGGKESDSKKDPFKNSLLDFTSEKKLDELNDYFGKRNIVMVIKPHPFESNQLGFHKLSNVLVVPHQFFLDRDIQLNNVLHYTDALITDFSGAYVDFLNLDRPIGFVVADLEDYGTNRGFVFDTPTTYMPGMKIKDEKDFMDFCDMVSRGVDSYKEERHKVLPIFSDYQDGDNCKRLAQLLKLNIDN